MILILYFHLSNSTIRDKFPCKYKRQSNSNTISVAFKLLLLVKMDSDYKQNGMKSLTIQQKIDIHLPLKIGEHQKLQTQLDRIKLQLNQKMSLFDENEYQSIKERINLCQKYFKGQKQKLIQQETNNTINNNHSRRMTTTMQQIQQQLPKKRSSQSHNKNYNPQFHIQIKAKINQRECIKYKNKVEQIDYSYRTLKTKGHVKSNKLHSKAIDSEKTKSLRYISQFQQRIKQSLSKITQLNFKYQSQYQIQKNLINQNRSLQLYDEIPEERYTKIYKKGSFDQRQRKKNYQNYKMIIRNQQHRKVQQHMHNFNQLQKRVQRCKTQLKEKHCENIKRLSKQKLDYFQKSERLNHMYGQFDQQQKNGNTEALDLMCLVTLAKADILLKRI